MPISRRLPKSNVSRLAILRTAFNRNAAAGASSILSSDTKTKVNAVYPLYNTAMQAVNIKKGLANGATATKNTAQRKCALYTNHGFTTIIMAVEREEMPKSVLAMYGLELVKPKLPPMASESDVLSAAENFINGETARVAAGGTALPMPTLAQVTAKKTAFDDAIVARDTADEALDIAQDSVNALNADADIAIVKVWDEVETVYNQESPESKRDKCRPWSVVYVSDTRITVQLQALMIVAGVAVPVIGAITLILTGETDKADSSGLIELKTGYTGAAVAHLEAPGMVPKDYDLVLDGVNIDLGEVTMVSAG